MYHRAFSLISEHYIATYDGCVMILIFQDVQENRRTHTGKCIDCKLSQYRIWEWEWHEWMCKHWQHEWCTL